MRNKCNSIYKYLLIISIAIRDYKKLFKWKYHLKDSSSNNSSYLQGLLDQGMLLQIVKCRISSNLSSSNNNNNNSNLL